MSEDNKMPDEIWVHPDDILIVGTEDTHRTKYTRAALAGVEDLISVMIDAENLLVEINPSNYHHEDVCHMNSRSVEAALLLQKTIAAYRGEKP